MQFWNLKQENPYSLKCKPRETWKFPLIVWGKVVTQKQNIAILGRKLVDLNVDKSFASMEVKSGETYAMDLYLRVT